MATIANIDPYTSAQVFKKEISFSTIDEISGQNIVEGYTITGPFNNTITPLLLAGGKKCVVAISSDSGEGAPYLKFHFPNGTSANKMYVTFAVKNNNMADGFYDYKTGIPTTYKNKLKLFIISNTAQGSVSQTAIMQANGVKTKSLRFTSHGSSTNKPAEAVTFFVDFKAVFNNGETIAVEQAPSTLTF